ncbi:electron-transfer flavoprotein:ubiquinone oxidoreductase [Candidatus Palauibacter polyketidifaciens]|uniref:electron transfer flavoprotein-ubiquinone oxidoreductase n=1 Tax=Candidatus Palauibacter polyketidifaciens TaxID=3056740 RepID=UPI00239A09B9|nr:electron-transfer flavoprotein:ubiquinone oxidoreductase [Candidatus Palauibacter polyketidifaciens]MDE2721579.1 electron-transfer flavoprotein:ubiquinone oxidoreductase [Candidatus Palauibacter polyketidifaciens]
MKQLIPAFEQPPLPAGRFIVEEDPDPEAVPLDVLFVGGGPAGLAGAIRLAQLAARDRAKGGPLADLEIGVLEKSGELGEHCLSGAVVNPGAFRTLFPDLDEADFPFRGRVAGDRVLLLTERGKIRLPTPPSMRNHGHHVASICEIVRWLGGQAEALGVNVFTGFPADALLMRGGQVVGVRTTPAGLDREGNPAAGYMPATDLSARVTVLAEGTRGPLSQAWLEREGVGSANPQIFALGVKELWEVADPPGAVTHTMGWPLPWDAFGGSFIYPMGGNLVSLGLVVGLDAPYVDLDVHALLQRFKHHPFVRGVLEGGELVEWGAKTIPEGGYHAIPDRLSGDGLLIAGDAAGLVDVASLKGIHYAMRSGVLAAEAIGRALSDLGERASGGEGAQGREGSDGAVPAARLASYDAALRESLIQDPLYRNRNQRLAFKSGFYAGGVKAGLMQATGGTFPGARISSESDAAGPRYKRLGLDSAYDSEHAVTKVDAVFRSGNATRDDIPSHLLPGPAAGAEVSPEMAEIYASLCPAGVYERDGDRLVVNAPNCIDCKATDVLGPRWTPREGGSGPAYKRM